MYRYNPQTICIKHVSARISRYGYKSDWIKWRRIKPYGNGFLKSGRLPLMKQTSFYYKWKIENSCISLYILTEHISGGSHSTSDILRNLSNGSGYTKFCVNDTLWLKIILRRIIILIKIGGNKYETSDMYKRRILGKYKFASLYTTIQKPYNKFI